MLIIVTDVTISKAIMNDSVLQSAKPVEEHLEPLDLEHFLPYRLARLSNQISRGIAATYQQRFGLSIAEWRVLAVVARFPKVNASELVNHTAMDKVALHRAVHALCKKGLLERHANHDDRRQRLLDLSNHGRHLHDAVAPRTLAYERMLLAALQGQEVRQLFRLLDKLDASVKRDDNEANY